MVTLSPTSFAPDDQHDQQQTVYHQLWSLVVACIQEIMNILTGWLFQPSEKYAFVNGDDEIPI